MPAAPTISVITTVYNVRDWLPAAVRSVLAQTFGDLELLLVDDGSTDGSAALCDELARTDARIRVFHKPNGGPASAANLGLDNARGEYVGFVNGDDVADPALYATLLGALRSPAAQGAAIAACGGDSIDEDGAPLPLPPVTIRQPGLRAAPELMLEAFETDGFYGPLSWNKLFARRLFTEKHICYDETMYFGDDASVLHRLYAGEQCVCLNDILYHYRTRRGQITGAAFPARKLDNLRMYWDWLQYYAAGPLRAQFYPAAVAFYWRGFYRFWCLAGAAGTQRALRPAFMAHKKNLDALLPDILRCAQVPAFEKFRAVLFCLSPELAYGLAKIWGHLAR